MTVITLILKFEFFLKDLLNMISNRSDVIKGQNAFIYNAYIRKGNS